MGERRERREREGGEERQVHLVSERGRRKT